MENSDGFGSTTAPLTWHDFLERMRNPMATDFVKAIKGFIVRFLNEAPDAEADSKAVQEFLANMEAAFRAHSLWAGSSEEELESAGEGLEKYVMTKLFGRVFASTPEDVECDKELSHKISLLQQFVRPEHLDIKPIYQNEGSWLCESPVMAACPKELQKINMYKAPRDKLVCILSCCKVINNLLLNASIASNEEYPGADEFLPVLIYVTIKANPSQLHSNLAYIQRFRRETRLVSEAAYFFTNMLSTESFLTNINAKALSMDEEEFQRNMDSSQSLLSGLLDTAENYSNQTDQDLLNVSNSEPLEPKKHQPETTQPKSYIESEDSRSLKEYGKDHASVSDLEEKGAAELLREEDISPTLNDFPYFFARTGDLTISDVEDLLNSYKQLVVKYVCLARGSPSLPSNPQQRISEVPETTALKVAVDSDTGKGLPSSAEDS